MIKKILFNKWVAICIRTLFGSVLLINGVDGFIDLYPNREFNPEATMFLQALEDTGYMYALIKGTEVITGAMLIANLFIPVVLLIIAPIILNIFMFEIFLSKGPLIIPLFMAFCEVYLIYQYNKIFLWLFRYQIHTEPNGSEPPEVLILNEFKEKEPEAYSKIIKDETAKKYILK